MFSAIPQRFTAPFGLLPDAEKLGFRSQPGGLMKLATVRNIPETDSYWNQYTVLFDSASEVYSLITPHDIRRALLDAPENIATLIRVIAGRLSNLISDHTFPTPTNTAVNAIAFMKSATGDRNTTKEVLNCIRVLQRVLPVVFEVEGEASVFEVEVLWRRKEVYEADDLDSQTPQFVIEDDDESDQETTKPVPKARPKATTPALGEKLFGSIVDLLFCCGFTLPAKIQVDHHKINYVIWEKGVGSTSDPGPNAQFDSNKIEVLRLLLVLLSRQIYVPPSALFSKPSLYSLHLVQKIPRRDVLTILCSLMNTVFNAHIQASISIGSMAGRLPYNHLVFKGEDTRSTLVATSLQVLIAALDFQSGSAKDMSAEQPTAKTNSFRYFVMKLHRTQDFVFIFEGFVAIFEKQLAAVNNMLPGARKSLSYLTETVILLWKILELNKKFKAFVLDHERCMDLVAHLLCYNLEIKDKPQQHGICRSLSYIIQSLSAEPSFGAKLSGVVTIQVPAKWSVPGTAADFLINAVYAIVATTSGTLNALYPALVISLSNSAPYFRHLGVKTSARLIQLLKSFSNPLFLLADEGHPRLLFFMLEVFNSVILHNLAENPNLIYGILSSHILFEDLGTFTLSKGLREIKRIQVLKEQQGNGSKSPRTSNDELDSEKSKLLLAESVEDEGASTYQIGKDEAETELAIDSPMSPTTESVVPREAASEKARGKQKERRSSSTDVEVSLERVSALGIGRNGFVPSNEWVRSWQQGLPLDPVMLVISELLPKIQVYHASRNKTNSTAAIIDFLGSVTLKEILPPVPALNPRRFTWTDASMVWLTSLLWGEIYLRGMSPLGIWNSTTVRLFYVKHSQHQQQHQITEAVSNVVGGLLRRTNSDVSIVTTRPR